MGYVTYPILNADHHIRVCVLFLRPKGCMKLGMEVTSCTGGSIYDTHSAVHSDLKRPSPIKISNVGSLAHHNIRLWFFTHSFLLIRSNIWNYLSIRSRLRINYSFKTGTQRCFLDSVGLLPRNVHQEGGQQSQCRIEGCNIRDRVSRLSELCHYTLVVVSLSSSHQVIAESIHL